MVDCGSLSLVVGADGLIGSRLACVLRNAGHRVVTTHRSMHAPSIAGADSVSLDLAGQPAEWQLPDYVDVAYILAGETSLSLCEENPDKTRIVNVENTIRLADLLRIRGAHLCYVSTNLVLAGDHEKARVESPIRPQCVYAVQKAEVERALDSGEFSASVLRVTKIAEGLTTLFTNWAADLSRGFPIAPFSDLVAAPMPCMAAVAALTRLGERRLKGVFHVGSDIDLSYDDMARMLAARLGADMSLVRPTTSTAAGVTVVAKPKHTTLETAETERLLQLPRFRSRDVLESLFESVIRLNFTQSDRDRDN